MSDHEGGGCPAGSGAEDPTAAGGTPVDDSHATEILEFWEVARMRAHLDEIGAVTGHTVTGSLPPQSFAFGDSPELADRLLAAVLAGTKTATTSSLWEFGEDIPLPRKGELSIVLDGAGHPRALIRTTSVEVLPFDQVGSDFALAEGEGDGSQAEWRAGHRRYFARVLDRDIPDDMPVVCERFEVRWPPRPRRGAARMGGAGPARLAPDTETNA